MTLDVERARAAVARLARQLALDADATAEGIVEVVNAAMARALRVDLGRARPRSPRLHPGRVRRRRRAPRLRARRSARHAAGAGAAPSGRAVGGRHGGGAAVARLPHDRSPRRSVGGRALRRLALPWRRRGVAALAKEGVTPRAVVVRTFAQMRYVGQSHELEVPLGPDYRRAFRCHACPHVRPRRAATPGRGAGAASGGGWRRVGRRPRRRSRADHTRSRRATRMRLVVARPAYSS